MIRHRGKQVVGVRYDLIWKGEVIETHDVGGNGGIRDLIAKCDRNPGMTINSTVYAEPEQQGDDEVVLGTKAVYPVAGTNS